MYIDAVTKVLYRTPVQNLPQPISLQLVCNSRSVQKLLYRSCCTEAPVQNVCTASNSWLKSCTERLYRTPVQSFCTAIFSFVIHIVLVIEPWNRHFLEFREVVSENTDRPRLNKTNNCRANPTTRTKFYSTLFFTLRHHSTSSTSKKRNSAGIRLVQSRLISVFRNNFAKF